MMRAMTIVPALLLTGCAALGGADYTYTHIDKHGASCSITVGSTRSIQGAGVEIDRDCTLRVVAQRVDANAELAKAIAALAAKVPSAIAAP